MSNRFKSIIPILLAGWLVFSLVNLIYPPAATRAQGDPLPTATPFGTPLPPNVYQQPAGGTIILQVYAAPAGSWTVVQWQDANGEWHDVEGWRSQLTNGYVGWWVAPANFASGPFRWLLLDAPDGETLVVSESFYLPGFVNETILIELIGE